MRTNPLRTISTFTAVLAAAPSALAQLHSGDIFVTSIDGRLVTGAIEDPGPPEIPARLFLAEFDPVTGFTNEPGYDSESGAFPAGATIGFDIRRALRVWDGADFAAIPVERAEVRLGPLGPVLTPPTDVLTPGFGMLVNASGEFHHHPGYTLLAPAAAGVYLFEIELWTDIAGVARSEPFWIVFNMDQEHEVHEEAATWVARFRANPCPPDLNLDEEVDFSDIETFIAFYNAGNTGVDFNADAEIDFTDVEAFVALFTAGC